MKPASLENLEKLSTPMCRKSIIFPDWPAPERVRAISTTRQGGVSREPFASFNLAGHVGDEPGPVAANRRRLSRGLGLPGEPAWLNQVHGRTVVLADRVDQPVEADAAVAFRPGSVCAVLTADCLPLLLCDREGSCVAAVHAGWRGLADGVIPAAVASLNRDPARLLAWLGPAIGPEAFEVGGEVRHAFIEIDAAHAACFKPSARGRWLADLYGLARCQLQALGVQAIYGGNWCTYSEHEMFFSYRRDGRTGRMASLIWLETG
jgi:hypothetical protein